MSYIKGKKLNIFKSAMEMALEQAYTQVAANGQLLDGNVMNADFILGTERHIDLAKRKELAETQQHMKVLKENEITDDIATNLMGRSSKLSRTEIDIRLDQMTFGEIEGMRDALKTSDNDQIRTAIKDELIGLDELKGAKDKQITREELKKAIHTVSLNMRTVLDDRWKFVDKKDAADKKALLLANAATASLAAGSTAAAPMVLVSSTPPVVPFSLSTPIISIPSSSSSSAGVPSSVTLRTSSSSTISAPVSKSPVRQLPTVLPTASSMAVLNPTYNAIMNISGTSSIFRFDKSYTKEVCFANMKLWMNQYPSLDLDNTSFASYNSKSRGTEMNNMMCDANQQINMYNSQKGKTGKGFKNKISLGNYLIDGDKLNNNMLSVTYNNGQKVSGLRNTKVSDELKKMIINKKVNPNKVKLTDTEKMFYQQLVHKSKAVMTKSKQKVTKSMGMINVSDLKDQLNIVLGERDCGNNSPEIKNEIDTIIQKLLYLGTITKKQASAFMSQI